MTTAPSIDRSEPRIAQTRLGPVQCRVRGTGAPVLVLHGSPGGLDQSDLMARFLPSGDCRVITLSRPGYLGTPLSARRSPGQQADLLAALLDALSIPRCGVLSWSGGGPSGYELAAQHPERVTSVVAIAAVSKPLTVEKSDFGSRLMFTTKAGSWMLRALVAHQPRKVVESTLSTEGSLTDEQLAARVEEVFGDEAKRRFVLDLSATVGQGGDRKDGWRNDCEQFEELEPLNLEDILAPCLLVHGSADSDVPPEHSREAEARLRHGELLSLDTGTHLAFYTHPEAAAVQQRAMQLLTSSR